MTSVVGSAVGRNFASANRAPREAPSPVATPSARTFSCGSTDPRQISWRYSIGGTARPEGTKVTFIAETVFLTLVWVMTRTRPPGRLAEVNRT
jgi:hypothetical protein